MQPAKLHAAAVILISHFDNVIRFGHKTVGTEDSTVGTEAAC